MPKVPRRMHGPPGGGKEIFTGFDLGRVIEDTSQAFAENLKKGPAIKAARKEWKNLGLHIPGDQPVKYHGFSFEGLARVTTDNLEACEKDREHIALVTIDYTPPIKENGVITRGLEVTIGREAHTENGLTISSIITVHGGTEIQGKEARIVTLNVLCPQKSVGHTFVLEDSAGPIKLMDITDNAGSLRDIPEIMEILPKRGKIPLDVNSTIGAFSNPNFSQDSPAGFLPFVS